MSDIETRISMLEHHVQKLLAKTEENALLDDQLDNRIAALEQWKDNCASFAAPPAPLNAMENITPNTDGVRGDWILRGNVDYPLGKEAVYRPQAENTTPGPEAMKDHIVGLSRTRRLARECGHEHSASVVSALERMAHEVAAEKDKEIQSLKAQLGNACDLAKHWKANHDNAVKIKREVLARPDLQMGQLRDELAAERHIREKREVELAKLKDDLAAVLHSVWR
jgi:hypothetical protein